MVFKLPDMRFFCLLKAVTPAWVINILSFLLIIDYALCYGSFEALQPRSNVFYWSGPRALNKHYSARGEPIIVSFMYIT